MPARICCVCGHDYYDPLFMVTGYWGKLRHECPGRPYLRPRNGKINGLDYHQRLIDGFAVCGQAYK